MHARIMQLLQETYPGVRFDFKVLPGQTGVDVTVLGRGSRKTGFKFAEIKPRNPDQERKLNNQVQNWGYRPSEVLPIPYDASGDVFFGF